MYNDSVNTKPISLISNRIKLYTYFINMPCSLSLPPPDYIFRALVWVSHLIQPLATVLNYDHHTSHIYITYLPTIQPSNTHSHQLFAPTHFCIYANLPNCLFLRKLYTKKFYRNFYKKVKKNLQIKFFVVTLQYQIKRIWKVL